MGSDQRNVKNYIMQFRDMEHHTHFHPDLFSNQQKLSTVPVLRYCCRFATKRAFDWQFENFSWGGFDLTIKALWRVWAIATLRLVGTHFTDLRRVVSYSCTKTLCRTTRRKLCEIDLQIVAKIPILRRVVNVSEIVPWYHNRNMVWIQNSFTDRGN